jgi:hypothetical protein
MTGTVTKGAGWMVYYLHITGEPKPRRIYWRNHNHSYIKKGGMWQAVDFDSYLLDEEAVTQIPVRWVSSEEAWVMF